MKVNRSFFFLWAIILNFSFQASADSKSNKTNNETFNSRNSDGFVVRLTPNKLKKVNLEIEIPKKNDIKPEKLPLFVSHVFEHAESPLNCRYKKKKYWDCLSKTELNQGQLLIRIIHENDKQTSFVFDLPLKSKK